ncbi:MAG: hypothetical protein WDN28_06855 [Chthoniobacter sp.]
MIEVPRQRVEVQAAFLRFRIVAIGAVAFQELAACRIRAGRGTRAQKNANGNEGQNSSEQGHDDDRRICSGWPTTPMQLSVFTGVVRESRGRHKWVYFFVGSAGLAGAF